ncbi:MAG: hypothetical protein Q9202_003839 [Teloschistes flavicans]
MPLTAHFHLPQGPRQTPSSSSRLTFHKGLETLSALISARNILPACGEWGTCDRAIEALGRGFAVTVTTTPTANNVHSTSKAGTQAMQQDEGGEREKGEEAEEEEEEGGEGVLDYLSAIAAACDRVSRLGPCPSTRCEGMRWVYREPRMEFLGLVKIIINTAAAGAGEGAGGEDEEGTAGPQGKGQRKLCDSSVQNLLAMCAE